MPFDELIFPCKVDIARYDVEATTATAPGINRKLGETRVTNANDGSERVVNRVEMSPVRLHAQVEDVKDEELRRLATGHTPVSMKRLVFDRSELEELGLLDPTTKRPLFKVGDRLVQTLDMAGNVTQVFPVEHGGLFAVQVEVRGHHFEDGSPNLVVMILEERATAGRT